MYYHLLRIMYRVASVSCSKQYMWWIN